jgi:hypothetical protein
MIIISPVFWALRPWESRIGREERRDEVKRREEVEALMKPSGRDRWGEEGIEEAQIGREEGCGVGERDGRSLEAALGKSTRRRNLEEKRPNSWGEANWRAAHWIDVVHLTLVW